MKSLDGDHLLDMLAFSYLVPGHFGANLMGSVFRYTPISDPDAKGYFDLLIKVCSQ